MSFYGTDPDVPTFIKTPAGGVIHHPRTGPNAEAVERLEKELEAKGWTIIGRVKGATFFKRPP